MEWTNTTALISLLPKAHLMFFPQCFSFGAGVAVNILALVLSTLSTDSYFSVDEKRNWLLLHSAYISLSLASKLQVFWP